MNPFRETIVSDPWRPSAVDVPEIQAAIFDECLRGLAQVRETGRSSAMLIHGGAGSGKTHLLSRLRIWLTLKAPTATDRDEALFVWVRLQASPRMIWRHVRRTLVEDWFRPIQGQITQFTRILFHRLAEIRIAEGDLEPWYEYMIDTDPAALDELLERVADSLYLDRNTTIAFKHLVFGRHSRDLRAWLGGDSLPEDALARLDLSQEDGTDEEREHEARRVVLMLCRLAGSSLPILLSLDQVEALQTSAADREGLFSFGQLVSTLHDETSNVFTVSCVQSAFATELKDKSRGADYDRMTSRGARSLATLTRPEAEHLIAARLAAAGALPPTLSERDRLWPLEPIDFHRLIAVDELTPRRLLATCAERFESWSAQPESTSSGSIAKFLHTEWQMRFEPAKSANLAERTEDILRHGLPQLLILVKPEWKQSHDDELPDVHLILDEAGEQTGISVCTQSNMRSVGEQLKRLKVQWSSPRLARLILVQDERVPLSKGAKVAHQTMQDLVQQGALLVCPSIAELAALDVMRGMLSDARAGDLAGQRHEIPVTTVEEWLRGEIPHELKTLVERIAKKR